MVGSAPQADFGNHSSLAWNQEIPKDMEARLAPITRPICYSVLKNVSFSYKTWEILMCRILKAGGYGFFPLMGLWDMVWQWMGCQTMFTWHWHRSKYKSWLLNSCFMSLQCSYSLLPRVEKHAFRLKTNGCPITILCRSIPP